MDPANGEELRVEKGMRGICKGRRRRGRRRRRRRKRERERHVKW
jgi:hypothetical protein